MDPYSAIQSQLDDYLQTESIHFPLSESSKASLKKWRPSITPPLPPYWTSEFKGLCRLRVMVQDQEEPEFCLSFFIQHNTLHSTLFGNFPENEVEYVPGIFSQRFPVTVCGVPGENISEIPPQVYFYNEMGEKLVITSIIDVIGVAVNSEFHVISFTQSIPSVPVTNRRDSILRGLEICTGSQIASEMLFFLLISTIQERSTLLGSFPLNLTNAQSSEPLKSSLKTLTRLVTLDFSLQLMNNSNFTPTKNLETEKLEPSLLQLPNNTLVLIDETKMTQGPLTPSGLENLNTLMQIIHSQTLLYNFGYTQLSFPTDLRFLICSNGKSMLKISTSLPLTRCNPYEFTEEDRAYLSSCSQTTVALPDTLIKTAQDFFISKRKENKITPEDFHQILLLTRYTAQSFADTTANESHWENALSLFASLSNS